MCKWKNMKKWFWRNPEEWEWLKPQTLRKWEENGYFWKIRHQLIKHSYYKIICFQHFPFDQELWHTDTWQRNLKVLKWDRGTYLIECGSLCKGGVLETPWGRFKYLWPQFSYDCSNNWKLNQNGSVKIFPLNNLR